MGSEDGADTEPEAPVPASFEGDPLVEIARLREELTKLKAQLRLKDQMIQQLQNKLSSVLVTGAAQAAAGGSDKKGGKQPQFSVEVLQRLRHAKRSPLHERETELSHRERLVMEVLTTEQSYMTGLEVLCQVYLNGLTQAAKNDQALKQEIAAIFGNIEQLRMVNEAFLRDLEEARPPAPLPSSPSHLCCSG